jgi:hypothetical protein
MASAIFACECIGQSHEVGQNPSVMAEVVESSLRDAKQSLRVMLETHDGGFLSCISLLLAVLEAHGQSDFAKQCLRDALAISEEVVGRSHAVTCSINHMLAVAFRASHRDQTTSSDRLKKLQADIEAYFGVRSRSALTASYQIGWALVHEKQYDEAAEVLGRLRTQCELVFGPRHIHTIMTAMSLARVYYHKHLFQTAEDLVSEMIGRLEKVFAKFHPYRLEARSRQAVFLLKLGHQYQETAEDIMREVIRERYAVLGPTNPRSIDSLQMLQNLLIKQGRRHEADNLWLEMSSQCSNFGFDEQQKHEAYRS